MSNMSYISFWNIKMAIEKSVMNALVLKLLSDGILLWAVLDVVFQTLFTGALLAFLYVFNH